MTSFSSSEMPPKRSDEVQFALPNLSQMAASTPASSRRERNLASNFALPVADADGIESETNVDELAGRLSEFGPLALVILMKFENHKKKPRKPKMSFTKEMKGFRETPPPITSNWGDR